MVCTQAESDSRVSPRFPLACTCTSIAGKRALRMFVSGTTREESGTQSFTRTESMARLLSTRVCAGRIAAAKTIIANKLRGRIRLSLPASDEQSIVTPKAAGRTSPPACGPSTSSCTRDSPTSHRRLPAADLLDRGAQVNQRVVEARTRNEPRFSVRRARRSRRINDAQAPLAVPNADKEDPLQLSGHGSRSTGGRRTGNMLIRIAV